MTKDRLKGFRPWIAVTAVGVAIWSFSLGACSSSNKGNSRGYYFPSVAVNGSSQTPPHSMPKYEYPFDSSGNYIGSWALAGNKGSSSSSSRSSSSSTYRRTSSSSSSSSSTRVHRVSSGDTLYGISRKYGVSVSRIKSANGLGSDVIRVGQSLRIPR